MFLDSVCLVQVTVRISDSTMHIFSQTDDCYQQTTVALVVFFSLEQRVWADFGPLGVDTVASWVFSSCEQTLLPQLSLNSLLSVSPGFVG